MENYNVDKHISIKHWAEDDRPREKLLRKGKASLSDAELFAVLLGSGYKDKSAVEVAQELLRAYNNNINDVGRLTPQQLQKFKGIGEAKAAIICAALELNRRRKPEDVATHPKVSNSQSAYDYMRQYMMDLTVEEFHVILLSKNNAIIKAVNVSKGGVGTTIVDVKVLFKIALENLASGIVLAHNHPSGNLQPSQEDILITQKIKEGATLLDISVLDHIIFTNDGYYSFADEGIL